MAQLPPDGDGDGRRGAADPAPRPRPDRLRQRADFLKAASARRQGTAGFLLQARQRPDTDVALRVGFTCSRKIGNAVARNRAKRRLRAVAAEVLPELGRPGWDYVLVGRPGATVDRNFADLRADLVSALHRVHAGGDHRRRDQEGKR